MSHNLAQGQHGRGCSKAPWTLRYDSLKVISATMCELPFLDMHCKIRSFNLSIMVLSLRRNIVVITSIRKHLESPY